jgi:Ni,Fe-hydrogenase III component G
MPDSNDGRLASKKQVQEENAELRAMLAGLGVTERDELAGQVAQLRAERDHLTAELATLRDELVETDDRLILQEVGVYQYSHPLDSSVQYRTWLDSTRAYIKDLVKADAAVTCVGTWQVNGSEKQGAKMVRDISKLMLRAYNAEADNLIRTLKPHKRDSSIERLSKTRETIARLGAAMSIRISDELHTARLQEISVTADYLALVEVEKEAEREERARLREEAKAAKELEREHEKLDKERFQYEQALMQVRENGDAEAIAELEAKLAEIDSALTGLEERAANTRAGHVYVISNVGAFGERMVKIGMTRRLDPMDRVRELGDASVPFRYDVHALVFSDDAVALETSLHQHFADRKVNLVNAKREFFYATAGEVKEALINYQGHLLDYADFAEAAEFRQSENERRRG